MSDVPAPRPSTAPRVLAGALVERRTWMEVAYTIVSVPLAVAGFLLVAVTVALGVVASITFVGLPVLAAGGVVARKIGAFQLRLAGSLLGEEVVPPPQFAPDPGFLGWLNSALRDGPGWRARAYLLLKLPLAVLAGMAVVAWASTPYTLSSQLFTGRLGGALTSLIVLFAGPWVLRGILWLDRRLVRALLGLSAREAQVAELQQARSRIAEDAATRLRRIERDLHDGTQAQLTALAMNLGQAKEKLEHRDGVPYDPAGAAALVDLTHAHAKDALAELRDIVRGIHPPALDLGLETALETLASRSALPVSLSVDLERRPSDAIESVAYFSATELLANALAHGHASRVHIELTERGGKLRLTVRDDGLGGAAPGGGTGLAGLAERLHAVDGHLDIVSPPGGPTEITIELPLSA